MATKADTFIEAETKKLLRPGEKVLNTGFVLQAPGLLMQALLLGPLLSFIMTKFYYAALTDKRLILIRTSKGFFGPGTENKGVEEIPLSDVRRLSVGGLLNNRSLSFAMADGTKRTLRIAPWSSYVSGQKAFFEEIPGRINPKQPN